MITTMAAARAAAEGIAAMQRQTIHVYAMQHLHQALAEAGQLPALAVQSAETASRA